MILRVDDEDDKELLFQIITLLAASKTVGPGYLMGFFRSTMKQVWLTFQGLEVPGATPIRMNVFAPSNSDGSFSMSLKISYLYF